MQRGEIFQSVQVRKPRSTAFDLSYSNRFSTNFGKLTPILVQEVLPGDSWREQSAVFFRMAPMLAPIMHRVDAYTHFFYVPNRLAWKKWKKFITGGREGTDEPIMPYFTTKGLFTSIWTVVYSCIQAEVNFIADSKDFDWFDSNDDIYPQVCSILGFTGEFNEVDTNERAFTYWLPEFVKAILNRAGMTDFDNAASNGLYFNVAVSLLAGPGSLLDFLGYPLNVDYVRPDVATTSDINTFIDQLENDVQIQLLPLVAMNLIYNDYYRDQNLSYPIPYLGSDDSEERFPLEGDIATTTATAGIPCPLLLFVEMLLPKLRAWEKDYFTSALPWAQRGPEASIPLADSVPAELTGPVSIDGKAAITRYNSALGIYVRGVNDGDTDPTNGAIIAANTQLSVAGTPVQGVKEIGANIKFADGSATATVDGTVDLSSATAVTINALRHAVALQRWLETNARGGARYIEQLLGHWGIVSSDATLQRPQYIAGGKQVVQISEVLQNSETNDTPLGEMAGHALSVGDSNKFQYTAEERGFIIGILSVRPRSAYQNGLPRYLTRMDKFDYAWHELAHLGEQEVHNYELFYDAADSVNNKNLGTFGYQSRFAEYKFNADQVHGDFKTSLNFWHLGRQFDALPGLNSSFVQISAHDDDLYRIFAVQDSEVDHIWCEVYNQCYVLRPLPAYGTPGLI